jgi:hypothetical protein
MMIKDVIQFSGTYVHQYTIQNMCNTYYVNIYGCLTWSFNNCVFYMLGWPIFLALFLTIFISSVDCIA